MPTQIGENRAKKMLKASEGVLCMGVKLVAHSKHRDGCGGVRLGLYRLRAQPDIARAAAGVCVAALAMGITPIARVNAHNATRTLDCGAQGSITTQEWFQ